MRLLILVRFMCLYKFSCASCAHINLRTLHVHVIVVALFRWAYYTSYASCVYISPRALDVGRSGGTIGASIKHIGHARRFGFLEIQYTFNKLFVYTRFTQIVSTDTFLH